MNTKWWVLVFTLIIFILPLVRAEQVKETINCGHALHQIVTSSCISDTRCSITTQTPYTGGGGGIGCNNPTDPSCNNGGYPPGSDPTQTETNYYDCPAGYTCETSPGIPKCYKWVDIPNPSDPNSEDYDPSEGGDWKYMYLSQNRKTGAYDDPFNEMTVLGSITTLKKNDNIIIKHNSVNARNDWRVRTTTFWGLIEEPTIIPIHIVDNPKDEFRINIYKQDAPGKKDSTQVCYIIGGSHGGRHRNSIIPVGQSGTANEWGPVTQDGSNTYCQDETVISSEGLMPGLYFFAIQHYKFWGEDDNHVNIQFEKTPGELFAEVYSTYPEKITIEGDASEEACALSSQTVTGETDWIEGVGCCGDDRPVEGGDFPATTKDLNLVSEDGKYICLRTNQVEETWQWFGVKEHPDDGILYAVRPTSEQGAQQSVLSNTNNFYACTPSGNSYAGATPITPGEYLPDRGVSGAIYCYEALNAEICPDDVNTPEDRAGGGFGCCPETATFGIASEFASACGQVCFDGEGDSYTQGNICDKNPELPYCYTPELNPEDESSDIPEEYCTGSTTDASECFVVKYDSTKSCEFQANNAPYEFCEENEDYVCNGIQIRSTEHDDEERTNCCIGECVDLTLDLTCEEAGGEVYDPTEQVCFKGDEEVQGEQCCFGTLITWTIDEILNTPESFLCSQRADDTLFAECCTGKSCFNEEFSNTNIPLVNNHVFLSGHNQFIIDPTDDLETLTKNVRRFQIHRLQAGEQTLGGVRFHDWTQASDDDTTAFTHLAFDIAFNQKDMLDSIIIYSRQADGTPIKTHILGTLEEAGVNPNLINTWQQGVIPLPHSDKEGNTIHYGNIRDIGVSFKEGTRSEKQPLQILFNNFYVTSEENTDPYVCSSFTGTWLEDVDPPSGTLPEDYKPYEYACNEQSSSAWTGNRCCGDDKGLPELRVASITNILFNANFENGDEGWDLDNPSVGADTQPRSESNQLLFPPNADPVTVGARTTSFSALPTSNRFSGTLDLTVEAAPQTSLLTVSLEVVDVNGVTDYFSRNAILNPEGGSETFEFDLYFDIPVTPVKLALINDPRDSNVQVDNIELLPVYDGVDNLVRNADFESDSYWEFNTLNPKRTVDESPVRNGKLVLPPSTKTVEAVTTDLNTEGVTRSLQVAFSTSTQNAPPEGSTFQVHVQGTDNEARVYSALLDGEDPIFTLQNGEQDFYFLVSFDSFRTPSALHFYHYAGDAEVTIDDVILLPWSKSLKQSVVETPREGQFPAEYYADTDAACFMSRFLEDDTVVGDALADEAYDNLVYKDDEFFECAINTAGVHADLQVSFDGESFTDALVSEELQGLCEVKGNYYCSPEKKWEFSDVLKVFSVDYMTLHGSLPPRGPTIPSLYTNIFCQDGEWKEATNKSDWWGNTTGVCPDTYCHCPQEECKYSGYYTEGAEATCLKDGGYLTDSYGADRMCDAGVWTSRTASVAQRLHEVADGAFTLHCDDNTKVFPGIIEPPVDPQGLPKRSPHFGTVCALQDGGMTIVGVPLTTTPDAFLNERVLSFAEFIEMDVDVTPSMCDEPEGNTENLYRCGETTKPYVYYDKELNVIYLSNEPAGFDPGFIRAVSDWISGLFSGKEDINAQFTHTYFKNGGKKIQAYREYSWNGEAVDNKETVQYEGYNDKADNIQTYAVSIHSDNENKVSGTANSFEVYYVNPDPDPWNVLTSNTR